MLKVSPLRPGLLVALRTSTRGNVVYETETLQEEMLTDTGSKEAEWKTKRTTQDPEEFERATKIRSKVRNLFRSVCSYSEFGLLCPDNKAELLDQAIQEATRLTDAFNAESNLTEVRFSYFTGRIMPDDEKAVRAISQEITDLLSAMESGVRNMDVSVIRENAKKARSLGAMLSTEAESKVRDAIAAARAAASRIVEAGEQAAMEVDRNALEAISSARTAFLDLDGQAEIQAPTETGRGVDLTPAVDLSEPLAAALVDAGTPPLAAVRAYSAEEVFGPIEIPDATAAAAADIVRAGNLMPEDLGETAAKVDALVDGGASPSAVAALMLGGAAPLTAAEQDPRIGRYEMVMGGTTMEFEVVAIKGDTARTDFGPMPVRNLERCKRIGELSEAGRRLQAMSPIVSALAAQMEEGE